MSARCVRCEKSTEYYVIGCYGSIDDGEPICPECLDKHREVVITRQPHREICSLCHEVSRVGFSVPNDIWEAAVHISQINNIICLRCFTRLADERGVQWDNDIKFFPVSQISHIIFLRRIK